MVPYVRHVEKGLGDGNYGFRALLYLLGRSEHSWVEMRSVTLLWTITYLEWYRLFLRGQRLEDFRVRLYWFHLGVIADQDYWMDMLVAIVLFATIYRCTLVYLNWNAATTILPLYWGTRVP